MISAEPSDDTFSTTADDLFDLHPEDSHAPTAQKRR